MDITVEGKPTPEQIEALGGLVAEAKAKVTTTLDRIGIETSEDWMGIAGKMPAFSFPAGWQVKIVPPFMGATCRFLASREGDETISVYFDANNRLGYYPGPYWEAYPIEGETARFAMEDTAGLIACMQNEFDRRRLKKQNVNTPEDGQT